MSQLRILTTLILALLFLASCKEKNNEKILTFSAIPDQNSTDLDTRYNKLSAHLEKELGVKFKYLPVKDYSAAVQAFKNGQIQLGWFGGLSGVQAQMAVSGANAIAMGKTDAHFKTYFIAHKSTGLQASESFPVKTKGLTFTFGSKNSTSGRLMPEHFLMENTQKKPDEFFSKVGFSGDHSKTISQVNDGVFKVGAVNFKVWEAEKAKNPNVSVIWKTPDYVDYNWTAHPELETKFGAGFTAKLQKALLAIKDPELLKLCQRPEGFIKAENSQFLPIKKVAESIGIIRK